MIPHEENQYGVKCRELQSLQLLILILKFIVYRLSPTLKKQQHFELCQLIVNNLIFI